MHTPSKENLKEKEKGKESENSAQSLQSAQSAQSERSKVSKVLEGAYINFISSNLTKTELFEVLKGNDEPIVALLCDMVSSDDELLAKHYSQKTMESFYASVTKQVRAVLVERQENLVKEEQERK